MREEDRKVFKNNKGEEFIILSQKGNKRLIQFLETNYVRWCLYENLKKGKVKDRYAITKYNIGFLGVYDIGIPYRKQAYQLWSNMMKRCYSDNDPKGYRWKGTKVDIRWHCFATFLNDLPKLPGFDNWLEGGQNLDKDMRVPNCNVYSFETCSFISEYENKRQGSFSRDRGVRAKYEKLMSMKGKD